MRSAENVGPADDPAQLLRPAEVEWPKASARELRLVVGGAMLTMVLAAVDMSIVNTALPRMASDLGGLEHVPWVVTAYLLTSTVTAPLYGKLSDMYGRRRLLVVSIGIFLAASTLCGLAASMPQLILFRALQGLGAGGLMTLAQAAIADLVPPPERGRYQGMFAGAFALSNVAGPLLGGALTSYVSWRSVFYVNLPLGCIALGLLLKGLRHAPLPTHRHQIDYAGAVFLTSGSVALLLLLTWGGSVIAWTSWPAAALAACFAGFFLLFLWQERRAAEPVLDLRLFGLPAFAIGVATTGVIAVAMFSSNVFLPLFLQLVLGLEPAAAGAVMLPQVVALTIGSVAGGRLSSRLGLTKPFILSGLAVAAIALTGLAGLAAIDAGIPSFLFVLALFGLGMGLAMPVVTVVVQNAVGRESIGVGTATMAFVRALGASFGVALSGGLMTAHLFRDLAGQVYNPSSVIGSGITRFAGLPAPVHAAVVAAYRHAIGASFLLSGAAMALALGIALFLPSRGLGVWSRVCGKQLS